MKILFKLEEQPPIIVYDEGDYPYGHNPVKHISFNLKDIKEIHWKSRTEALDFEFLTKWVKGKQEKQ